MVYPTMKRQECKNKIMTQRKVLGHAVRDAIFA